jgi:hypothetical protein
MTLARFPFDQCPDFIDFRAKNGCQRKHAANALVDKVLGVAKGIESFRLSVTAGESLRVIPCPEATNAEMVRRAELIVVVTEEREEVLELSVSALQRSQVGDSVTSREKVSCAEHDVLARGA